MFRRLFTTIPAGAAALAALALLCVPIAASAVTDSDETPSARVVNERGRAAFLAVGVADLQRFTLFKKAIATGQVNRSMIAEEMDVGLRYADREPLFAGSVFGAVIEAYDEAEMPKDGIYAGASYWNALSYDRICAQDGELCQALADIVLTDHPGSPYLKASLLRYLDYARAAQAAGLAPDRAREVSEKCLAAHSALADRAHAEGRGETPPYDAHRTPACEMPGTPEALIR